MRSFFSEILVFDMGWVTLNVAYLIYAGSGIFKDVLRLRVALLAATFLYMVYGPIADVWSVFWWNIPVAAIHIVRIAQLVNERRGVNLDRVAYETRDRLYSNLDDVSFAKLWAAGTERRFVDEVLIHDGEEVPELFLVLDGTVEVDTGNGLVYQLGKLDFVGEMSGLAGSRASATVRAVGEAHIKAWNHEELQQLTADDPVVGRAHLLAISETLARKVRSTSQATTPASAPPEGVMV